MIIIATTLIGAGWGGWLAKKRKGNRYDIAQYAVVYGILFALLGLFLTILLGRSL